MICPKCGTKNEDGSKFCNNCGARADGSDQRIQYKCKICNGTMESGENSNTLVCPYCGSKEVIKDSDDVAIAKIRAAAYKNVEEKKLSQEKEMNDEQEGIKYRKSKKFKSSVFFMIASIVVAVILFSNKVIGGGLMFSLVAAVFLFSIFLGLRIFVLFGKANLSTLVKIIAFILLVPAISISIKGCDKRNEEMKLIEREKEFGALPWPQSDLANRIPKPNKERGRLVYDTGDTLSIEVADVTLDDFNEYVEMCVEKGFDIDYSRDDSSYDAKDKKGYDLTLSYEDDVKIMGIMVATPPKPTPKPTPTPSPTPTPELEEEAELVQEVTEDTENTEKKDDTESTEDTASKTEDIKEKVVDAVVDPDMKAFLDSYEAYIDEYVEFLKKYNADPTSLTLLAEYGKMLERLEDLNEKADAYDEDTMNDIDLAYYLEVMNRCNQKLLSAY